MQHGAHKPKPADVLHPPRVQGVIKSGGVQWMTAGRGIVHSEMPKITDGDLWGFQLWINLPAKDKMIKPRYQDYQAEDILTVAGNDGCSVRVMAGEMHGKKGKQSLASAVRRDCCKQIPGGNVLAWQWVRRCWCNALTG
jgi:redox-sensitive bicupin YhaK (pirin superfamily)